ncbi:GNAT family N-acetyltransferase [soil metagenome]
MEVRGVNPRDDAVVAAWFGVIDAGQRAGRPDEPGWLLQEQAAILRLGAEPDTDERRVGLVAVQDGQVVAAARLDLPMADNTHLADVLIITHPGHRRRGAGRALVQEVERQARGAGRTTLTAASDELPGEQGRSASRGFGPALGFAAMQEEVRRDIALPLDPAVAAGLAAVAAEHAADYDLRSWHDAVPEDLVEDQAQLFRRMSTDVPLAELDWREELWDAARVRRDEHHVQVMDRTFLGAGAVHRPTGRMVAYTTMGVPRTAPQRAYQWDTLVLTEHRGHRLGTLVKLACLQRLAEQVPEARVISTWNAAENAPMIRVNDALGARVNGQLVNWQKRLV